MALTTTLTAAPEAQAALLDLHRLDTELSAIEHRRTSLPERAEAERLRIAIDEHATALAQSRGTLEDAQREQQRLDDLVGSVKARLAQDTERMMAMSSAKDIAGIEHEIDSLQRRRDDLEEQELEAMEQVEQHEAQIAGIQADIDAATAELEQVKASGRAALEQLAIEHRSTSETRAQLATTIPADLVALYTRQRERYGAGASHLHRGASSVSGVALLGDELDEVRAAAPDAVLICPSSEAILVRTAESGL